MSLLKLVNICKNFGTAKNPTKVLKNISLEINSGEFIAIIGQSGSGKSTLMNILGCLDIPSSGEYYIDNNLISNFDKDKLALLRRKKFGFIFQRYNLLSGINATENVALPAVYAGINYDKRIKRAKELLENLNLSHRLNYYPSELSGGQQQRISIARSLMNGGEIILADEPTGALDSKSGELVLKILEDLHKIGHTIILVTHDLGVANHAKRIIEIKDGEIIKDENKSKNENYIVKKIDKIEVKNSLFAIKDMFVESFKMAVGAILSHKLRSLLTMLGIIIGIASVVSVVAIGKGSQEKILADINAMGTNTITIFPGKSFGDMRANNVKTLSISDARLLDKQSYVMSVTPNTSTNGTLTFQNLSYTGSLLGGNEQSINVNGLKLEDGRFLDKNDVINNASVVVIDSNTKNNFFPNSNPIGKVLLFNKQPLKIIGVLKPNDTFGNTETLRIYSPYTTVINKITGDRNINSITIRIKDNVNMQLAQVAITELISTKHGKQDFFIRNSDSIRQTVESATGTMRILISAIALISLIVGGIGVMNIMLVSVTERTKEIGLKMAIGAKSRDILMQFLVEAVLICVIGGIFGLILSFIIGFIFMYFVSTFAMTYSMVSIVISLISSMFIGIIFGFMPAKNAANLNPIDALSRE
ncbi:macrolide export ATP-binding/permease MacB [Campylobacter sputorum subsp. bubulus]|uniref:Pyoverdine export ATP-binding/permease protein PvdT n=1 Tax=Campylobacter sputorum subsp. sputorum TaxID=32024 RepID=A0A381DHT6_9BACT|nr:MacB family efflux pump subunit [Campylobacter sputorum]ASM35308.1 macrolide-specific efflux protein, ATP-binding/permease protein MacB [Campylobacter sputorum aubsp. sputorum RM3237]KAB0582948.1 MacB family efflux pump subunit [Campylobacter sputorum subsp. sputorum]QEL05499.1 macrolide-specific efflux protein, ATP-binding/permease protein MacB [Campylobacter sputorum subsp. sputorum]SUX08682.1 macrolide export ATP-binding/permease MacB [Campylobacter sputorum subsp. bubulus]SUX10262.1 mac